MQRSQNQLKFTRVAQASSAKVLSLAYSLDSHYEYLPLDELHPCLPDEPWGVSKVQALFPIALIAYSMLLMPNDKGV